MIIFILRRALQMNVPVNVPSSYVRVIATSVLYTGQRSQQLSQTAVGGLYWHNVSEDDLILI